MHTKVAVVGLLATLLLGPAVSAQQSLNLSLFERYLAALREEYSIPGLSVAVVQGGRIWSAGFGHADVGALLPALPDTPYPILGLSQTLSSTLLLQQCVDFGHLELSDRVQRWVPNFAEEHLTIAQLLSHATSAGAYQYNPARFAAVGDVIYQCTTERYPAVLADEIFGRFAMTDSVPGADLANDSSPHRMLFARDRLADFAETLQRMALPYRVDDRGRASRSSYPTVPLDAATGAVSSVLDLANFDLAIRDDLLESNTLRLAWSQHATPAGLGWLIQRVGNDTVVWQYGVAPDAYSSLVIKVPGRDLSLILLSNSDRLGAPYASGSRDVTASIFAQLFFRIFLV